MLIKNLNINWISLIIKRIGSLTSRVSSLCHNNNKKKKRFHYKTIITASVVNTDLNLISKKYTQTHWGKGSRNQMKDWAHNKEIHTWKLKRVLPIFIFSGFYVLLTFAFRRNTNVNPFFLHYAAPQLPVLKDCSFNFRKVRKNCCFRENREVVALLCLTLKNI